MKMLQGKFVEVIYTSLTLLYIGFFFSPSFPKFLLNFNEAYIISTYIYFYYIFVVFIYCGYKLL